MLALQAAKKEPLLHAPAPVVMSKANTYGPPSGSLREQHSGFHARGDIPLTRQPPPPKPPLAPSAEEDPAMSGLMGRVTSLFSRALYKHPYHRHSKHAPSVSMDISDSTALR